MKFLHISDLHIGRSLHGYSLLEEQRKVLRFVIEKTGTLQVDALLIAGDIYDKSVPSAEAVELFDWFLTTLKDACPKVAILVIAGNHDNAKRVDYASGILNKQGIYIEGALDWSREEESITCVTLKDAYGEVHFYLLPYFRPIYANQVKERLEAAQVDTNSRNVLLSHQFYCGDGKEPEGCDSELHILGGLEQIDTGMLEPFDYVALGHIHGPQCMGRESVRYCGTLLKYSISEEHHKKNLLLVELQEKGTEPILTKIPIEGVKDVVTVRGTLEEVKALADQYGEDFVRIVLCDEVEHYRPRDILEGYYSSILEIQIDNSRTRELFNPKELVLKVDTPKESFANFFSFVHNRDMTMEEEEMLNRILLSLTEVDR